MKIKIIEDKTHTENTVTLTCHTITDEIQNLIDEFENVALRGIYRGSSYQIIPKDILFFETDLEIVYAHTLTGIYETKYRLYELEEALPRFFIRISKSSIINTKEVSSVDMAITSSRAVSFYDSKKKVYVSRKYYPLLKEKLNERSL
ncbi:MAG: LytTR family transcriptional regulator [Erysipelothrix sp.]|nr:LytTR family transcriptional regulator [Erysipelothrix sp.]